MIKTLVLALGIAFEGVGLALVAKSVRISQAPGRCGACDYDLRGHETPPTRCPECGEDLSVVGISRTRRRDNVIERNVGIALMVVGALIVAVAMVI